MAQQQAKTEEPTTTRKPQTPQSDDLLKAAPSLPLSRPGAWQRRLGNQALGRLIIRPKLTVNAVGDKYEQEADAVASEAVKKLHTTSSDPTTIVQRQELLEDDKLHRKNTEVGTTTSAPSNSHSNVEVAKTTLYKGGAIPNIISSKILNEKGNGHPLPNDFRKKIESILGYDFSNVRIHASHQAHHLNSLLAARAFTIGEDIFFKIGEYNPFTFTGQELLAHELTHVIQQIYDSNPEIQRSFLDGEKLQEDFWGLKQLLGEEKGGAIESLSSARWNYAGAMPLVGTPISLVSSIIDSGKSIVSSLWGDIDAGKHFSADAIASATSAIPIWGTGQGLLSGVWDTGVAMEKLQGKETAPSSSFWVKEVLPFLK